MQMGNILHKAYSKYCCLKNVENNGKYGKMQFGHNQKFVVLINLCFKFIFSF